MSRHGRDGRGSETKTVGDWLWLIGLIVMVILLSWGVANELDRLRHLHSLRELTQ